MPMSSPMKMPSAPALPARWIFCSYTPGDDVVHAPHLVGIERHVGEIDLHFAEVTGVVEDPAADVGQLELVGGLAEQLVHARRAVGMGVVGRPEIGELAPILDGGLEDLALDRAIDHAHPQVAPLVVVVFQLALDPALLLIPVRRQPAVQHVVVSASIEGQAGPRRVLVIDIGEDDFPGLHFIAPSESFRSSRIPASYALARNSVSSVMPERPMLLSELTGLS